MRAPTAFAWSSSALVLAAMVGGMVVIGSPWDARDRRLDEQRVRDLQAISAAVEQHAALYGALPPSLDALQKPSPRFPVPVDDPVSGQRYEFAVTGASTYEICAVFDAASEPGSARRGLWEHPAGHHCFPLEVPPEPRHNP